MVRASPNTKSSISKNLQLEPELPNLKFQHHPEISALLLHLMRAAAPPLQQALLMLLTLLTLSLTRNTQDAIETT